VSALLVAQASRPCRSGWHWQAERDGLGAVSDSLSSLYDKLHHTEPELTEALVLPWLLRLKEPTADGDTEIRPLTNLSPEKATAADVYRRRWRIEGRFLERTTRRRCEVDTLGYPKAALLGFALAVCACNVLRVVSGALEQVEDPSSSATAEV
jgi:hypothetical protein